MTTTTTTTFVPASPKQAAFITSLLPRMEAVNAEAAQTIRAAVANGEVSKADASGLIDSLLAIKPEGQAAAAPAAAPARTNRYAAKCETCGDRVEAEAGVLVKDGKWKVFHAEGQCSTTTEAAPAADGYEPAKGDVHVLDGVHYRVYIAQGSGRPYAATLTEAARKGDYARGVIQRLSKATLITAEQAAEFGHLSNNCIFCGHAIDTPQSTAVGYGPDCAANRGLPWGVM